MMAVEIPQVDYQRVRSLVKSAFSPGESPYSESIGADMITDKKRPHEFHRSRLHFPGQPWATTVHANESRRPGRSKILLPKVDRERERMIRKIDSLQRPNKAALSYFYDGDSVAGKHPAKALIWAVYLPRLEGCNTETKAAVLSMLDSLLPQYRQLQLQGEFKPIKQPWTRFLTPPEPGEEDGREKRWYATYRKHWLALWEQIQMLDEGILDILR